MIKVNIKAGNLRDFYIAAEALQRQQHGENYTAHHVEIQRCMRRCRTAVELGVNQGVSLARILLCNPRKVTGVDIALEQFARYEPLFRSYAAKHGIDLRMVQSDSRTVAWETDFLHIDSLHNAGHLAREIAVHLPRTRRFALFHDTGKVRSMHRVLEKWCSDSQGEWKVLRYFAEGVGYTLLERRTA